MARERQSWQLFEPRQERIANVPCYLTDLAKHQGVGGMSRKAEEKTNSKSGSDGLEIEDALKAPHHAYKILFFNKEQMDLLTTNRFPYVLFMCDFGTGTFITQL